MFLHILVLVIWVRICNKINIKYTFREEIMDMNDSQVLN